MKLLSNEFIKNVLTLFTGTSIAHLLPILISPILTRIYGPEEFGIFALYTSIVAILSVLSTGRYELAIIIPEKDVKAINIAGLAIFINIIVTVALFFIILLFGEQLKAIFGLNELGNWIYFIPFSIIFLGSYQIIYYWFNRRKYYKEMSVNKVIQQASIGTSNILIGYISNGVGLIFGTLLGQLLSLSLILKKFINKEKKFIKQISIKEMVVQAKRYINFPKYLTFSHTLNTTSSNLSTIIFTSFFNTTSVGYYSLTQRILRIPVALIGSSISDVFRQKAAEEINENGSCRTLYLKTLFTLFCLAIIPFSLLYLVSPWLFSFIFGEHWRIAGEYARLMMPMLFFQFITSPLSSLFLILEKQKLDLIWQIALFFLTTGALLIGIFFFNSIEISIILVSTAYSIMYIVNGIITYRLAS